MGGGGQRLGPESEARALSYAFTRLVGPHHFLFPLVRAHCVLKPFLLLSKQAPRGCFRVCLEDLSELWAQSFGRFVKKRLGPAHGYIYFPLSNRLESLSPPPSLPPLLPFSLLSSFTVSLTRIHAHTQPCSHGHADAVPGSCLSHLSFAAPGKAKFPWSSLNARLALSRPPLRG